MWVTYKQYKNSTVTKYIDTMKFYHPSIWVYFPAVFLQLSNPPLFSAHHFFSHSAALSTHIAEEAPYRTHQGARVFSVFPLRRLSPSQSPLERHRPLHWLLRLKTTALFLYSRIKKGRLDSVVAGAAPVKERGTVEKDWRSWHSEFLFRVRRNYDILTRMMWAWGGSAFSYACIVYI